MTTINSKPSTGGVLAVAALALGGIVGARYLSTRKISASERLADALLDTEPLREAARNMAEHSELRLAACANYLLDASLRASDAWSLASGANDPIGYSRSQSHRYTQAVATVLTEAHTPEHILTYTVKIPDIAEIRGTRKRGPLRLNGIIPAYPTPETAQIALADGYTAQVESSMELAEAFVTGKGKIFGAMTLRDNHGNVGRLNIGNDGSVNGTITRDAQIVGRFNGRLGHDVKFQPYQIEPGEH